MIHRFILNEVSYFGPGARKMLPQEIKRLGLHKALVATDKELIRFGVAQRYSTYWRKQAFLTSCSVKSSRILP